MLKLTIEHGLRLRVANALANFCIMTVGALGIILYVASDNIEEAHIRQVMKMEMDHLVHRYRKHSDFYSQIGSHLKSYVIHHVDDELQIPPITVDYKRAIIEFIMILKIYMCWFSPLTMLNFWLPIGFSTQSATQ